MSLTDTLKSLMQSRSTVTPEAVACAVLHAAAAKHPRARCPVGAVARLLPAIRRLTPDRQWKRMMLLQVGVIPGHITDFASQRGSAHG